MRHLSAQKGPRPIAPYLKRGPPMAQYALNNSLAGSQQNMTSSYKTAVSVFAGSTARRGKIYDVLIGTDGTPADNAVDWDISRMTVDGTGSAPTPQRPGPD